MGEGDLFLSEVSGAARQYADMARSGHDPAITVRTIRNDLDVEAVSVIGSAGSFLASTSDNRLGVDIEGFLANAFESGSFSAIAQPIAEPIELDGVQQWARGDVVYRVISPLDDAEALLVEYDVSALLVRRARQAAVQPVHLAAGAFSMLLLAGR